MKLGTAVLTPALRIVVDLDCDCVADLCVGHQRWRVCLALLTGRLYSMTPDGPHGYVALMTLHLSPLSLDHRIVDQRYWRCDYYDGDAPRAARDGSGLRR